MIQDKEYQDHPFDRDVSSHITYQEVEFHVSVKNGQRKTWNMCLSKIIHCSELLRNIIAMETSFQ